MYKKTLFTLLILGSFLVSACGTQTVTQQPSQVISSPISHVTKPHTNIQLAPDATAARIPKLFYQYVTARNFKEATKLLGPQLKFETAPSMLKYLQNIVGANFLELRDISKNPGPIDPNYEKYYRIKVYYAKIMIKVANPNLVAGLNGVNYRKFILIKISKNSPWLIDTDEDTPKME